MKVEQELIVYETSVHMRRHMAEVKKNLEICGVPYKCYKLDTEITADFGTFKRRQVYRSIEQIKMGALRGMEFDRVDILEDVDHIALSLINTRVRKTQ